MTPGVVNKNSQLVISDLANFLLGLKEKSGVTIAQLCAVDTEAYFLSLVERLVIFFDSTFDHLEARFEITPEQASVIKELLEYFSPESRRQRTYEDMAAEDVEKEDTRPEAKRPALALPDVSEASLLLRRSEIDRKRRVGEIKPFVKSKSISSAIDCFAQHLEEDIARFQVSQSYDALQTITTHFDVWLSGLLEKSGGASIEDLFDPEIEPRLCYIAASFTAFIHIYYDQSVSPLEGVSAVLFRHANENLSFIVRSLTRMYMLQKKEREGVEAGIVPPRLTGAEITLRVEDDRGSVRCNRSQLARCSGFFRHQDEFSSDTVTIETRVFPVFPDIQINTEDLQQIEQYSRTGRLDITSDNVVALFALGNYFEMDEPFQQAVHTFLKEQCSMEQLVRWIPISHIGQFCQQLIEDQINQHLRTFRVLSSLNQLANPGLLPYLSEMDSKGYLRHVFSLNLSSLGIDNKTLRLILEFKGLSCLHSLNLEDNLILSDGVGYLVDTPNLEKLVSLNLAGNYCIKDAGGCALSRKKFTTLNLAHTGISCDTLRALAESSNSIYLTSLNLNFNSIGVDGLEILSRSENLSELSALYLNGTGIRSHGIHFLGAFKKLTELDLGRNSIVNDWGLKNLAMLENLSTLRVLSLESLEAYGFQPRSIAPIVHSRHLRGLTSLSLSGNDLGDEGARLLASAEICGNLRTLDLSFTCLGDRALTFLSESEFLSHLEALLLDGNHTGIGALIALADSRMRSLERLTGVRYPLGYQGARIFALPENRIPRQPTG